MCVGVCVWGDVCGVMCVDVCVLHCVHQLQTSYQHHYETHTIPSTHNLNTTPIQSQYNPIYTTPIQSQVGSSKVVRVHGIHNIGRTATVLLRGSNKLVLEEADRSLHDALCVVRCLVQKQYLIPGGGAPEVEVGAQLAKWSQTLQVGMGGGGWVVVVVDESGGGGGG